MNELQELKDRVERIERELQDIKRDRFSNLSSNEVERLKGYIIERTASNVSGSVNGALIITVNGERRAIPTYPNFPSV